MLHWELRLFIQLAVVEVPFIYPLKAVGENYPLKEQV